ncbi:50S ribosomal protein L25 [Candidatus Saccharibacteria bacterium]|nr:50S ribosomal protein L25 [Candidatus Saccharibacteria bacterium]
MSSDTITLNLTERKELGKAVKALRREGFVPANIYERGKESIAVSASYIEINKVYSAAGKHHPVELLVDGKKHLAMIKDVDMDPVKNVLRHISFHAVNRNETVEAEIPVKIEGEIPAERASLMVLHTLDTVVVEALPANLPDELTIDGSKLVEVGDKVSVADIVVPQNVVIMTDSDQTVAVVEEPKDQIAAAAEGVEEEVEAAEVPSEQGTEEVTEDTSEEK